VEGVSRGILSVKFASAKSLSFPSESPSLRLSRDCPARAQSRRANLESRTLRISSATTF
jgi:hypothetical protein